MLTIILMLCDRQIMHKRTENIGQNGFVLSYGNATRQTTAATRIGTRIQYKINRQLWAPSNDYYSRLLFQYAAVLILIFRSSADQILLSLVASLSAFLHVLSSRFEIMGALTIALARVLNDLSNLIQSMTFVFCTKRLCRFCFFEIVIDEEN